MIHVTHSNSNVINAVLGPSWTPSDSEILRLFWSLYGLKYSIGNLLTLGANSDGIKHDTIFLVPGPFQSSLFYSEWLYSKKIYFDPSVWVSYICIILTHCNIFRYCGTETPSGPIISTDNQMLIVFQTNYTIPEGTVFTQTGFKAELSITSGKCNQCVKVIDFIKCFGCSNVK